MKFLFKETPNSTCTINVATIFEQYSTARLHFGQCYSVQEILLNWLLVIQCMAALDPMYSNILSQMIHVAAKLVKKVSAWKNAFCWPWVICRFFSLPPILSQTYWCHLNTSWLQSTLQNGSLQSHFFRDKFLQDSSRPGTSEAKTLVSGKVKCLLATLYRKKTKY